MEFDPDILLYIPALLFSLSVHECAHAYTAKLGGDDTSEHEGRITLNPASHIDPFGTILMPVLLALSNAPLFGWARPVPVNEGRLRHSSWLVWVSMAGPLSNILLAIIAAVTMKVVIMAGGDKMTFAYLIANPGTDRTAAQVFFHIAEIFIYLNLVLAVFNMLPVPPLDGSKLVYYYVIRRNFRLYPMWVSVNQFGFILIYFIFMIPALRNAVDLNVLHLRYTLYMWLGL